MKRISYFFGAITAAMLLSALTATAAFADDDTSNKNTQTGVNVATSQQSVAAVSGDAVAAKGSVAISGDAYASAKSYQSQNITQIGANQVLVGSLGFGAASLSSGDTKNKNTQTALNDALNAQSGAAISGNSVAYKGSASISGAAVAKTKNSQRQSQFQLGVNQGLFLF